MLRIRLVPFEAMGDGMRALVQASDEALGLEDVGKLCPLSAAHEDTQMNGA